jgi:type VI protein secretion system component VasK
MTGAQLAMGAAGAAALGYWFVSHQRNKNSLDKASDRFEQARQGARQSMGDNSMSTAASKTYYDAKERVRN